MNTTRAHTTVKFSKTLIISAITFYILFVAAQLRGAQYESVSAGVAKINLTPPLEMKAALGGYGERESRPAIGVHDAVWAKALLLARGEQKFVVVTADVLGFPPRFKAAVVERLSS